MRIAPTLRVRLAYRLAYRVLLALGGLVMAVTQVGPTALGAAASVSALPVQRADQQPHQASSQLSVRVAMRMSAEGVAEFCIDLRDAAAETRLCPGQRSLLVERAPQSRWMRSRSVFFGPELSLWVRARREGDHLRVGLGIKMGDEARNLRRTSWSFEWRRAPRDLWQRTTARTVELPAEPHPELWDQAAKIVSESRRLELDQPAPEFRLPRLDAEHDRLVSLSDARNADEGGVAVILVFWSSWAPYASETLLMLGELAQDDPDLRVVGINVYESSLQVAAEFAAQYGDGMLHLSDAHGAVAEHYRVDGVPEIFLIDADGVYRGAVRGPAPRAVIMSAMQQLVGGER